MELLRGVRKSLLRRGNTSWILLVMCILMCITSSKACPNSCDCKRSGNSNGTVVQCRFQRLTSVPVGFPNDTLEIDLGYNSIKHVTMNSFPVLPSLKKLVMDNCEIRRIEELAFSNLANLEYLEISSNAIVYLDERSFRNLPNLRELRMDKNNLEILPGTLFQDLNLQHLYIRNNNIRSLGETTFSRSRIANLNLDENDITNITEATLVPLRSSLKQFRLSHNKRPLGMEEDIFSGFNFSTLTFSYNGIRHTNFLAHVHTSSLDISGQSFSKLNLTNCTNLRKTEEIYLRNLSISSLDEALMSNFREVRVLDLSYNRLYFFDGNIFRFTPRLVDLKLDNNIFMRFPDNLGMHLSNLQMLKASNNRIAMLKENAFQGMDNVRELVVSNNRIQVIAESMKPILNKMTYLRLDENPLYCNCEMRWFRLWLADYRFDTGADQCASPKAGYIWDFDPEDFVCEGPKITSITPSQNVQRGTNVYLNCRGEGDPAPEVQWEDHRGDKISITPPFDRTRHSTPAIWNLKRVTPAYTGWFTCRATNVLGEVLKYTYVNVVEEGGVTVDVSLLVPPTTPTTTTTTTTSTTTTQPPTTTTQPTTVTTTLKPSTSPTITSTNKPTTTVAITTTIAQFPSTITSTATSSISSRRSTTSDGRPPRPGDLTKITSSSSEQETPDYYSTTLDKDDINHQGNGGGLGGTVSPGLSLPMWAIFTIVAVAGGVLVFVVVVLVAVHCMRRRKYIRQYQMVSVMPKDLEKC